MESELFSIVRVLLAPCEIETGVLNRWLKKKPFANKNTRLVNFKKKFKQFEDNTTYF